jgi:hypothetical protein
MAHSTAMTTPLRRSGGLAALLVALLVAACGTTSPSPSPAAPGTTPSAEASGAPSAGATPAPSSSTAAVACDPDAPIPSGDPSQVPEDPAVAALYTEIERQVTGLRGISPTTAVERGVFDKTSLCAYLKESFGRDNPEELVTGTENLYKALLLMPEEDSLQDLYLELLTSQVAGLYDEKTKKMYVVVSESGEIGPAEQITYAHEFTHALQDQKFVLGDFIGDATDQGDRTIARATVVEGDATLLMSLWAQQNLTPQELGEIGSAADPASAAILERAPAILKDSLLFPYTGGLQLALAAFQGGGFAGVDGLYANPPDTTEQVLHPEKFQADEQAVAVDFPAGFPASLGEGWKTAVEDTLGEFQLEIFVRDAAGAGESDIAVEGWGGDRVAFVEGPGGANAAIMDTAWDTDADAAEFAAALEGYVAKLEAAGRAGAVLTPSPGRVVVISASDADTLGAVSNVLGLAG